MKIIYLGTLLILLSSLTSCRSANATDSSDIEMLLCKNIPNEEIRIKPNTISISWATASPEYSGQEFRLIPTISLSGIASGGEVNWERNEWGELAIANMTTEYAPTNVEVFLQFWPNDNDYGAVRDSRRRVFYFNYPFSHMDGLLKIIEGLNPLQLTYKVQAGRCVGYVEVLERPIPSG